MRPDFTILEVVIPAYNAEKYIAETLESVFRQKTNFEFSVHISDDCSSDSTLEICEKFKKRHPNLKITKQAINLGMTRNQHFVITHSVSKYIAYLDSDDVFDSENYLQSQLDFLEHNDDVICVFSNVTTFIEATNKYNLRFSENKPPLKFDLHYFFQHNIAIANSAMVFRQKYNSSIPSFFSNYFQYDWLLHIYHGLNGKFGYNDILGTVYRIHNNNATNIKFSEKKYLDGIKLIYAIKSYLPQEYHRYFKYPLYELNSLAFLYLRERRIIDFLYYYFKWFSRISIREFKVRDQFWLFRQALFRKY
jgi:glycosyltransferase involved in cell wall biosynthesis